MKLQILKKSVSVLLIAFLVTGTFPGGTNHFYRAEAASVSLNSTIDGQWINGTAWIETTSVEGRIYVRMQFNTSDNSTERWYRFDGPSGEVGRNDSSGTFTDDIKSDSSAFDWNGTFSNLPPGTYTFKVGVETRKSGSEKWHPSGSKENPGWKTVSIALTAPTYSSSTISPTTMSYDDARKVTVTVTFTQAMNYQRNISGYLGATPVTFVYKSGVNTATHTYEATVPDDVQYTTAKLDTFSGKLYATASNPPAINKEFAVNYDTRRSPTLTTSATVSNLRGDSATLGGNVSAENGATVTSRGVCYGTSLNPTVAGSKSTHASGGTGAFTVDVSDLAPQTTYHYRAYAVNTKGTSYGEDRTFTTVGSVPTVTTSDTRSGLSNTGVTVNGAIAAPDGLLPILERGAVYVAAPTTTPANPTTGNSKGTTGSGGSSAPPTAFSSVISGLTPGQTYHYRAFLRNILGTAYGVNRTFTTTIDAPVITATANSSSLVTVNWSTVTGATAYEVYIDGGSQGTQAGTSFSHNNPGVNTQHSYKVQALGAGLLSGVSDAANARSADSNTVDRYALANAPTLTVSNQTPDQGKNNLTIIPGANPGITQYYLEYSTDNANWINSTGWSSTTGLTAAWVHSGLTAGTTYYYRVKARNGDAEITGVSPVVTSKINSTPVLTATTATNYRSAITGYTSFTLSGMVSDQTSGINGANDSSQAMVSATINGKAKSTTITGVSSTPKAWNLTWDMVTDTIVDGSYPGIIVSGDDGQGRNNSVGTVTWANTLYVDRVAPSAPSINPALTDAVNGWTRHSVPVTIVNGVDSGGNATGTLRSEYMLSGATTLSWTNFADFTDNNVINITNTGTTTVTARTRDQAGNISSLTTQLVKIDKVLPTGSLAITARIGAHDKSAAQQVNLGITSTDTGGRLSPTPPVEMEISNNADFTGSTGWITYATSRERWLLLAGSSAQEENTMQVYIRFKDEVGNVSSPISIDSIALDMSAPVLSLSPPSAAYVRSGSVTYDLTLNDATASFVGVSAADKSKIQLTADGDMVAHLATLQAALTVTNTSATTRRLTITIPPGLLVEGDVGVKILEGAAIDPSGNVSGELPANFSFTVDSKPPTHQDQLLPTSLLRKGGEKVELAKTSVACTGGYPGDSIRLAPAGYNGTDPANGQTITSTHGESAVINLPTQTGEYYLYILDPAGNVSEATLAKVTVQNEGPTVIISEPNIKNVQQGSSIYYIATYDKAYEAADITINLEQDDIGIVSTGDANAYVVVSEVAGQPMQRKIALDNIMGDGTIGIQIAPGSATDIFGNPATGSAESPVVNVDNTAPTLTYVGMSSDNQGSTLPAKARYAKHGDTITLNFTADEALQEATVAISGTIVAATAQNAARTQWQSSYTVPNSVTSGGAVAFGIAPMDLAGNLAAPLTDLAGGGLGVTLDITPPVITLEGTLADPEVPGIYTGDITLNFDDLGETTLVNNTTSTTTHPVKGATITGGGSYTISVTNIVGLTSSAQFTIDQTFVDVDADLETVTIGYAAGDRADYVTRHLTLPLVGSAGSQVRWASSDEAIVTTGGAITRAADADKAITLTATISNASATNTKTKEFNLTVKKAPAGAEESYSDEASTAVIYYAAGDNAQSVTADFALGAVGSNSAPVTWSTSSSAITIGTLSGDRYPVTVVRPATGQPNATVQLTANIGYQVTHNTIVYTEDSDYTDILEIVHGVCNFKDNATYYIKDGANYVIATPGAIALVTQETISTPAGIALYQKGDGNHQPCDAPVDETAFTNGQPYYTRSGEEGSYVYTPVPIYTAITSPPGILYTGYLEATQPADEAAFTAGQPYYTRSGDALPYTYQLVASYGDTIISTTQETSFAYKDPGEVPTLYVRSIDTTITDEAATATFDLTIKAQGAPVVVLTDQQKADADAAQASVSYVGEDTAASVTQNVGLSFTPVNGSSVSWSSSDETVISVAGSSGLVTRSQTEEKSVTLTATIASGEKTATRSFNLTVKQAEALGGFAGDLAALAVGYRLNDRSESVTQHVILPTEGISGATIISWISNSPAVATDGTVTRSGSDAPVTLIATIEDATNVETKTFTMLVKARKIDLLESLAEDSFGVESIFAPGDSAGSVTQNLNLRSTGVNGSNITWSSSYPSVIADDGQVVRGSSDTAVELTMLLEKEAIYVEKSLTVTVKGQ